jgi:hypothetical protein
MRLTVVLGASGEASFDINLNNNSFTRKWVKELQWCLDNCEFNQREAFSGLLTLHESEQILNNACVTINKYMKGFIKIETDYSQEYFNYLHSKFEQLSGKFGKPTRLFSVANAELKSAIRDLNHFVHRIEKQKTSIQELYISFDKDQYRRHLLSDEDYEYFVFKTPPGTLFLYYVELGKEFIDLYNDNLELNYPGFANLHYYSGEATLNFIEYDCFSDKNYLQWLTNNNINPYNKTLGHGKIALGTVDNFEYALNSIQTHRHIDKILIKE